MRRDWADVWVGGPERRELEQLKLFFIPGFDDRVSGATLTTAGLVDFGKQHLARHLRAGRDIIERARAGEPVAYSSCGRLRETLNAALSYFKAEAEKLTRADVVACVFRIKDIGPLMTCAGVTAEELATATGIPLPVVNSAVVRRRLTYDHADRLWRYFLAVKQSGVVPPEHVSETTILQSAWDLLQPDQPALCIRPDLDHEPAVGWHQVVNEENGEVADRCVYRLEDIRPAPLSGHPWALDPPSS